MTRCNTHHKMNCDRCEETRARVPLRMPLRRTSVYTFETLTEVPMEAADVLRDNCIADVAASGVMVNPKRAFVRFRASSDDDARGIADRLTDAPGTLHTGYGVNHRVVSP